MVHCSICFSLSTMKNLYHLWVCVNFLNFIAEWSRLEFLKPLLIHAWAPTYLINGSREIHEANSNSQTTVLAVDEHFQDPRGTIKAGLSNGFEKNSSVSQNLFSWTNCHWSHVYKHHHSTFPIVCLLPLYCSHISRLKDQKCQLLANRFIFSHRFLWEWTQSYQRRKLSTLHVILGLLSDFC